MARLLLLLFRSVLPPATVDSRREPVACAAFDAPEPPVGDGSYPGWLYDSAGAAHQCGDHAAAADAYRRLYDLASQRGLEEFEHVAAVGLARAWFLSPSSAQRREQLAEAVRLLRTVLTDAQGDDSVAVETRAFASSVLASIETELATPPDPVASTAPPRAVVDRPPGNRKPVPPLPARPTETSSRAVVGGVAAGALGLAIGLGLATAALAVRPWYGARYVDAPGYTREVARDLTRPWVVAYGVSGVVTAAAGATLLGVLVPRLRAPRRVVRTEGSRNR